MDYQGTNHGRTDLHAQGGQSIEWLPDPKRVVAQALNYFAKSREKSLPTSLPKSLSIE
jgi:hypothetical protein